MDSRLQNHVRSAASAALAAAMCMAIVQIVWLAMGEDVGRAILYGLSISSIAFGGTYAGVFFTSIRKGGASG
ncbi:hypothetical protein [Tomitella cavernea]|uniref:Uncharacterized protein n=1 Tax=Tomitella cavernea TaxID=1387982 RepID=A0ABP9CZE9_9ACTN|nr:hypothetical protein [Tomitella cavernea]